MTRSLFGGRVGDIVASLYNLGSRQVLTLPVDVNGDPTSVTLQVWDAVDGTQLTDLLAADGTTPITTVVVPATGQVPEFYGPDGVNIAVYVKDPDDHFYRLDARADAAVEARAAAEAAAADSATSAATAAGLLEDTEDAFADLIAVNGTGVVGLAVDTDGRFYYDPDAFAGTTPALALGVDTDGQPYVIGA